MRRKVFIDNVSGNDMIGSGCGIGGKKRRRGDEVGKVETDDMNLQLAHSVIPLALTAADKLQM